MGIAFRFLRFPALILALAGLTLAQGPGPTTPAKEYVRINGRVIATIVCPGCPTVTLTDNSNPGTTHYKIGDSFTVTIKGAPNSYVTVVQNNGTPYSFPLKTDGNGNWSLPGSWGTGNNGSYSQQWSVGPTQGVPGTPAIPTLNFTVYTS